MKSIFIIGMLALFPFSSIIISEAYAYIDPGTGSLFIQVIIGAIVGVGITVKIYWYKLKEKITGMRKKSE